MQPTTVRTARLRAGLKTGELALISETPQPNLSSIENGYQTLTLPRAERLAAALGVCAEDLLAGQQALQAAMKRQIAARVEKSRGGRSDE